MKYYKYQVAYLDNLFSLELRSGITLCRKLTKLKNHNQIISTLDKPQKVKSALDVVNNPYLHSDFQLFQIPKEHLVQSFSFSTCASFFNVTKLKLFTFFIRNFFFFKDVISFLCNKKYSNTTYAILNFRRTLKYNQENLCLPRTFYAAYTSESFRKNGVLFIGIMLPQRTLHAWIIEDGINPDPYDYYWTQYQPLAAFYY